MKSLTPAMQAAVSNSTGSAFRYLLQIDPDGSQLYLASETIKIGSTKYIGDLISVDPLNESIGSSSDQTIEVLDTKENRAAIDLAVDVKLYVWAVGTADSDKDLLIWGEVSDPIEYSGGKIRFDIISRQYKHLSQSIGKPILKNTYLGADPDEIGKTMPVVYGTIKDHVCLAIDAGSMTTISNVSNGLTATATDYIQVSDAASFPHSGTVQIDQEQIKYSSRNDYSFIGLIRGVNSTIPVSHDKGAVVAEVQTVYEYLVADHPVAEISDVKVDGVLQSGDDFQVIKNENGVAKIKFTTRPSIQKSVDIEIEDTTEIYATQPQHTHTQGAGSIMVQQTKYTGYALRCSGPTFGINYSNIIHFDEPPNGVYGGYTSVRIATNSAVRWGIGYVPGLSPNSCFYSERQRIILAQGYGNWYGDVNYFGDQLRVFYLNDATQFDIVLVGASRTVFYSSAFSSIAPNIDVIRSGTISLTGNSVSETVIGRTVTCTVKGHPGIYGNVINTVNNIAYHILQYYGKAHLYEIVRDSSGLSSDVSFASINIDESATVKDVIYSLADQTKRIIHYSGGRWRIVKFNDIYREPDFTITDYHVKRLETGESSVVESRTGLSALTNKHVWRAGLKPNGSWTLTGIKENTVSQSKYGIRQKNIDLPYLYRQIDVDNYISWISDRESDPNRKRITMTVSMQLYAIEIGDLVRYSSVKNNINILCHCVSISQKGLTESTITLEQV